MVIVSGFDKAKIQPFLAYSPDDGAQWIDVSFLAQTNDSGIAAFVTEDAAGRPRRLLEPAIHELVKGKGLDPLAGFNIG